MNQILRNIEAAFKRAMNGQENIQKIIWQWGAIPYFLAFFVFDYLILKIDLRAVDIIVSILVSIYFIWHIYVLGKCTPKKPQLSKEEKEKLHQERKRDRGKRFLRKLMLQEPITEWDPVFISKVIDIFFITYFLSYLA